MEPRDLGRLVSWLYLDMNSFFASVEQEMNPSLRGKPVAVVPLHADTTSCIAVSYEGKSFGIKTGTKVGEAKKLCPKMIFVAGDHSNYVRYHDKIVAAVETCLPVEAVCSIDEIACRLTGSQQNLEAAKALAAKVKSAIKTQVGVWLKCSIGLAPNRYLAKIAADMQKPDGLTALLPRDLPQALHRLTPRDLPGVGRKMEARLNARAIDTMERLCALSAEDLRRAWGSVRGEELWHLLRGKELKGKETEQKSISRSHVLPPEMRQETGALKVVKKLTVKAAASLRKQGFFATNMQVYVGFLGQDGWKARCGLMETQDTADFLRALAELWQGVPRGTFYIVGVALTGLVPESHHTPDLFENPSRARLNKALDDLNRKFGKDAVYYGAVHESGTLAPLRIAFSRIPEADEK